MNTQTKPGAIVLLVGAGLIALGSLLPWATVRVLGISVNVNGTEGDGQITLVLGLAAAAFAIFVLVGKKPLVLPGLGFVAAALTALVGVIDFVDIQRVAGEGTAAASVQVGFGLYLVMLGAGTTGVGAILAFRALRREQTAVVPAVWTPPQPAHETTTR